MIGQANQFFLFSSVNDNIQVKAEQELNTTIATFSKPGNSNVLLLCLKEYCKGYFTLSYHVVYNNGTDQEEQTSQDHSLPFPANCVQYFVAQIVNNVF
jgi:hypothetical protein|nr:MAG TPA: hypothetical protein [Caudoviricetes sp.]